VRRLQHRRAELGRLGAEIAALSPLAVLDRGYAMVRKQGAIIRDASQVKSGDHVEIRLAKGVVEAEVK